MLSVLRVRGLILCVSLMVVICHTFTPSHPYILTSSHLHTLTSHILTPSHLTSSHHHTLASSIFTPSHPHLLTSSPYLYTSHPHHHTLTPSHLTPSHPHILKPSQDLSNGERANYEQNVQDAMAVFPKLQTGLDVNVKFNRYKVYERDGERGRRGLREGGRREGAIFS